MPFIRICRSSMKQKETGTFLENSKGEDPIKVLRFPCRVFGVWNYRGNFSRFLQDRLMENRSVLKRVNVTD